MAGVRTCLRVPLNLREEVGRRLPWCWCGRGGQHHPQWCRPGRDWNEGEWVEGGREGVDRLDRWIDQSSIVSFV